MTNLSNIYQDELSMFSVTKQQGQTGWWILRSCDTFNLIHLIKMTDEQK